MRLEQWKEGKRSKIVPIINKLLRKGNLEGFLCEVKANKNNEKQKIKFERT